MPKIAKVLSDIEVRNLKNPGLHSVGGIVGLKLQVGKTGSRSWILRATIGGGVRDIGLGNYPSIKLKTARELAEEIHRQIQLGIDPVEERRKKKKEIAQARANRKTFDECAETYISSIESGWKNVKTGPQWRSSLKSYASPVIGKLPVSDITVHHILRVLTPIWTIKAETASRVRARIEAVLAFATTQGYRKGDNPARLKGNLDTQLPSTNKFKNSNHHPALPYIQISTFFDDLQKSKNESAKALAFMILTAARSGEVRGATWKEIDLVAQTWRIPSTRMKAGKEHIIPLSNKAVAILNTLTEGSPTDLVFPGVRGGSMSDVTLSKQLKTLHKHKKKLDGVGYVDPHQDEKVITPHGFRSTFRDWAGEQTNFQREVIEHALAHQLKDKAEAAYQRKTSVPKRIKLMQEWADYCAQSTLVTRKVTKISKKLTV